MKSFRYDPLMILLVVPERVSPEVSAVAEFIVYGAAAAAYVTAA